MSKRQHIIFAKSTISGRNQDSYFIDVMTETFLSKYLDMVHSEMETFKKLFQRKKREVLQSIDKIVADAKVFKVKNKGKPFREILEI